MCFQTCFSSASASTNGKVERFNRTPLDEWAHDRPYRTETERRDAFPGWLHTYNHHRGHTALKGQPPASRVPNLSGRYVQLPSLRVCTSFDWKRLV